MQNIYTEEYREYLEKKYLHLFEVYNGEESDRSYYKKGQILRGIETPEGWNKVVETLLRKFEWIRTHNTWIDNPNFDEKRQKKNGYEEDNTRSIQGPDHEIKIFQIKQKFGCFECYVTVKGNDTARRQVDEAISWCSALASVTCENCGKVSELITNKRGWIASYCPECTEEMKASKGAWKQLSFNFGNNDDN